MGNLPLRLEMTFFHVVEVKTKLMVVSGGGAGPGRVSLWSLPPLKEEQHPAE